MPWDAIARRQHNRDHLHYPSDLTDRDWSIMEPFIPPAKSGGRPGTSDMREVLQAHSMTNNAATMSARLTIETGSISRRFISCSPLAGPTTVVAATKSPPRAPWPKPPARTASLPAA